MSLFYFKILVYVCLLSSFLLLKHSLAEPFEDGRLVVARAKSIEQPVNTRGLSVGQHTSTCCQCRAGNYKLREKEYSANENAATDTNGMKSLAVADAQTSGI